LRLHRSFENAGANRARTIMCHIDTTIDTPALRAELAASGCTLEYDSFDCENSYYSWSPPIDMPNDLGGLRCLRWLIDRGYIGQLVISHDICFKDKLFTYGGAGHARRVQAGVTGELKRREPRIA